jgi:8-amino-7-oxononanoate synthase
MLSDELALRLSRQLAEWRSEERYRSLRAPQPEAIDLVSNDYLGLRFDPHVRQAAAQAAAAEGVGSGGSRLLSGHSARFERLETAIARYHRAEAALFFNSGWEANQGLLATLPGRTDTILYDERIHASMRDGIRQSYARSYSFPHNDLAEVERLLKRSSGQVFVAVEALYSMDGDVAPLAELADICHNHHAGLIVDEAHAAGVRGEAGSGLVCELGLEGAVLARIITYGKAFGAMGAAVVCAPLVAEYLVNACRCFIYTTAAPPAVLAAVEASYERMPHLDGERARVHQLTAQLRQGLCEFSEPDRVLGGEGAIVAWVLGKLARPVANFLQGNGFDARPVVAPTVEKGSERIRFCLHSFNRPDEVDELLALLRQQRDRSHGFASP